MELVSGFKRGQNTILVVDDDAEILKFISELLRDQFNIILAKDGAEGLECSKQFEDEIDLLLTDFHMPKMSGVELAIQVTHQRPTIKVLIISSSPNGIVLNDDWHFLEKSLIESQLRPLTTGVLARKDHIHKSVSVALLEVALPPRPPFPELSSYRLRRRRAK